MVLEHAGGLTPPKLEELSRQTSEELIRRLQSDDYIFSEKLNNWFPSFQGAKTPAFLEEG